MHELDKAVKAIVKQDTIVTVLMITHVQMVYADTIVTVLWETFGP